MELGIYHIVVIIFSFFSAFFSGSETALISSNYITLSTLRDKKKFGAAKSIGLIENMDEVLSMVLIGNNISNTTAASFITLLALKTYMLNESSLFLVTLAQALVFLLFCEIFPKIVSRFKSETILRYISYPLFILLIILKPLSKLSLLITSFIKNRMEVVSSTYHFKRARDEISVLFQMGEKAGIIDKIHQSYVEDILSLHKMNVKAVMTPIKDVVSIELKQSIRNVIKIIKETRFSRIPVYKNRVDNMVGYVYYRDFIKIDPKEIKTIEDIMRKPEYVPIFTPIYKLFKEMEKNKKHMVFAVNEYGGVEGVVTREDIAEEIVGEIQTRDHPEKDLIVNLPGNRYSLSGSLDIDYFSKYFNIKIEKKGFETVAGFLLYLNEIFPRKNDKIIYNDNTFIIDDSTEKEIKRVIYIKSKRTRS